MAQHGLREWDNYLEEQEIAELDQQEQPPLSGANRHVLDCHSSALIASLKSKRNTRNKI